MVSKWHGGDSMGQSGKEDLSLHQAASAAFPRRCKESPKLYSSKGELLLSGECLPCQCFFCTLGLWNTMGLTSSFIAHISIQRSSAVSAQAAIADQHPSAFAFPGPWGTSSVPVSLCPGEGATSHSWCWTINPCWAVQRESTGGLVHTSLSSLTATSF